MDIQLSVVIVTKNRQDDLLQCLGSLVSNSSKPDEIILVDNNSTDNTRQLIQKLKQTITVPIYYDLFTGDGYPTIYNRGLDLAQFKWVCFIDDDCIADINWVRNIRKTIHEDNDLAVIMGSCDTFNKDNIFSLSTLLFDNEWKRTAVENHSVINYEVLDNKNIVYNKTFLKKK